jgi:acyl-CoA thioester hydrolase
MKIDIHLRWSDIDGFGHLNNAVMATLIEEARARFFYSDSVGADLLDEGVVVANQSIQYLKPVFYSVEPLEVSINVSKVGSSSFDLSYVVRQGQSETVSTGTTTMVRIDLGSGKPRRLSEPQVEWLNTQK